MTYVERVRRTEPWADIAAHFARARWLEPMVELVEHVGRAPYAHQIHGCTSMHTLFVAQTAEIFDHQEVLRVEWSGERFVLTVHERGPQLTVAANDPALRRVSRADGIAAFERLLHAKRWI